MTFEDKMNELEKIVTTLEKGECRLDEAMTLFKQGVTLSKECSNQLEQAQQLLVSIDDAEQSEAKND